MAGSSAFERDPRVDEYIERLPDWQRRICERLRELIHAVDPEVTETIKRTVQPYFVLEGNICALLAAKDHVNLFLYDGGIVPDPEAIITGGHTIRQRELFRSGRETRSTDEPWPRCSSRSSPTTAPVAGANSRRDSTKPSDPAASGPADARFGVRSAGPAPGQGGLCVGDEAALPWPRDRLPVVSRRAEWRSLSRRARPAAARAFVQR